LSYLGGGNWQQSGHHKQRRGGK